MSAGRLVGRALLVLVDAVAAGSIAAVLAFLAWPLVLVGDRIELAIVAGAAVTGIVLAIALALARRGSRPFPATRALHAIERRLWPWI